ncbi:MAG: hypothetical protein NC938_03295 [Candidatus Omnitrophica bacterium]|nr:hypothetical protein [Candidatus Omnitrophota bacterium]MCM8790707.1 hypothetical protein [Candidatus Omnitrophota bacterium]
MRFLRLITFIVSVTIVALLYVHQQVELVKISYVIECKEYLVKEMLDRNERLGYNIKNLEAPYRLEEALLAKSIEVAFPKQCNVVRTASPKPARRGILLSSASTKTPGLLDFLMSKARAQTHVK